MATEPLSPKQEFLETLRRRARGRSQFWPGAGFALLGHPVLAAIGTATIALLLATFFGFAVAFRPFWMWLFVTSLVLYLWFYIAEQIMCRSISIHPSGKKALISRFFLPFCVPASLVLLGVIILSAVLNLGSMRVAGSGMAPTMQSGDLFLYRKHVFLQDLRPGHLILFRTSSESAWGKGGDIVVGRILAMAGQQLSIEGDHYLVDGKPTVTVAPLGKYRPALEIPQLPRSLKVPPGCYFIVQDDARNSFDSQVLSWAKKSDLVGTRAIMMSGHAFAKELE